LCNIQIAVPQRSSGLPAAGGIYAAQELALHWAAHGKVVTYHHSKVSYSGN